MKTSKIIIALGVVSLVVGIISRVMLKPLPPIGLEAKALLQFANSCFLLAMALSLTRGQGR